MEKRSKVWYGIIGAFLLGISATIAIIMGMHARLPAPLKEALNATNHSNFPLEKQKEAKHLIMQIAEQLVKPPAHKEQNVGDLLCKLQRVVRRTPVRRPILNATYQGFHEYLANTLETSPDEAIPFLHSLLLEGCYTTSSEEQMMDSVFKGLKKEYTQKPFFKACTYGEDWWSNNARYCILDGFSFFGVDATTVDAMAHLLEAVDEKNYEKNQYYVSAFFAVLGQQVFDAFIAAKKEAEQSPRLLEALKEAEKHIASGSYYRQGYGERYSPEGFSINRLSSELWEGDISLEEAFIQISTQEVEYQKGYLERIFRSEHTFLFDLNTVRNFIALALEHIQQDQVLEMVYEVYRGTIFSYYDEFILEQYTWPHPYEAMAFLKGIEPFFSGEERWMYNEMFRQTLYHITSRMEDISPQKTIAYLKEVTPGNIPENLLRYAQQKLEEYQKIRHANTLGKHKNKSETEHLSVLKLTPKAMAPFVLKKPSKEEIEKREKLLLKEVLTLSDVYAAAEWVETTPQLAAQVFRKAQHDVGKVFLAYLYFKEMIPITENRSRVEIVRELMQKATKEDIPQTLQAFDFVRYMDGIENSWKDYRTIPCSIFRLDRDAVLGQIEGYYYIYQHRDVPSCKFEKAVKFTHIPEVNDFLSHVNDFDFTDPDGKGCGMGSSVRQRAAHGVYNKIVLEAKYPNILAQKKTLGKTAEELFAHLGTTRAGWATYGLWNRMRYDAVYTKAVLATKTLAAHYKEVFNVTEDVAVSAAYHALVKAAWRTDGILSKLPSVNPKDVGYFIKKYQKGLVIPYTLENYPLLSDVKVARASLRNALLNDYPIEVIEFILKVNAESLKQGQDWVYYKIDSPWHIAASYRVDVLDLFIRYGADLEEKNSFGKTALMYAVQQRDIKTVQKLIALGANINAVTNPLPEEAECGEYLNAGNRSVFMYATWQSTPEIIDILLHAGVNTLEEDTLGLKAYDYLDVNKTLTQEVYLSLKKRLR